jgi:methionine biosynthesis protein MetW
VIVSFPNFSHYSIRLQLLYKGVAPKNDQLPYSWYDSPNIRVITLKDFRKFSRDVGYNILKEITISTNPANSEGSIIRYFADIRATYGIFIIEKIRNS